MFVRTSPLSTDAYDYDLPAELIAQHPLRHRSDARLMIVDRNRGEIEHAHVRDLADYISPADVLVLNDSRVIPARLVGCRQTTGGKWEGLFLSADQQGVWQILCKARGRLAPGECIVLQDRVRRDRVELDLLVRLEDGSWAARPRSDLSAVELLEQIGQVPLPHYIRRGKMVDQDVESYQTVYARHPGSVAAPTAGLHFTPELLARLSEQGTEICHVTLHVGVGTFRTIRSSQLDAHSMHSEWCRVEAEVVERLLACRRRGGRVVAVGTTAVRTLETAARDGVLHPWMGGTDLFIRPPFQFHAVDALMTNFHLPRSTLLVLVRTFGGDALMRRAYQEAIDQRYRFFSYGDAMLIL